MPELLQKQVLQQLHINHIGNIEKTEFLACTSVDWIGMTSDIENYIKFSYMLQILANPTQRKNYSL